MSNIWLPVDILKCFPPICIKVAPGSFWVPLDYSITCVLQYAATCIIMTFWATCYTSFKRLNPWQQFGREKRICFPGKFSPIGPGTKSPEIIRPISTATNSAKLDRSTPMLPHVHLRLFDAAFSLAVRVKLPCVCYVSCKLYT